MDLRIAGGGGLLAMAATEEAMAARFLVRIVVGGIGMPAKFMSLLVLGTPLILLAKRSNKKRRSSLIVTKYSNHKFNARSIMVTAPTEETPAIFFTS